MNTFSRLLVRLRLRRLNSRSAIGHETWAQYLWPMLVWLYAPQRWHSAPRLLPKNTTFSADFRPLNVTLLPIWNEMRSGVAAMAITHLRRVRRASVRPASRAARRAR